MIVQAWRAIIDAASLPPVGTEESECLDFKESPWGGGDGELLELTRDVAQFANHVGGTIIVGAAEDGTDRLSGYVSIQAVAQRVVDACYAALSPRLTVDARVIERSPGIALVVVNVPAHDGVVAIKLKGVERWEFYRRVGKGKKPFSFEEVEHMWTDGRRGRVLLGRIPEQELNQVWLDVTEGRGVAISQPAGIRKQETHFQVVYHSRVFNFPYEWIKAVWPSADGRWSIAIAVRFQMSNFDSELQARHQP